MSRGKIVVAMVALLALAIIGAMAGASYSSKVAETSPDNIGSTGTEAKHFSLNLNEYVNIKSNP